MLDEFQEANKQPLAPTRQPESSITGSLQSKCGWSLIFQKEAGGYWSDYT